jgi:integrase
MGRAWRIPVAGATEQKSVGRQRLTDAIVRRLPPPAMGKAITVDADVPGFGARVTANGARSYILRYTTRAGRERTCTIGDAATWRTTDARDKARALRREIEDGGDPLGELEDERAAPTMPDLIERFRAEHLPKKRPGTTRDYEYLLRLHIEPHFGVHTKVADVRFEDVDALHRKITKGGSTYAANRCIAVLSKMFSLAIRWRMRESNPAKGIERNKEYHRRRYLSGDELVRLTKALAKHRDRQAADAIRMLLLTGARRGEVLGMRWDDVADGVWSKPASSTKQKEAHEVPLSAPALQLLSDIRKRQRPRAPFVFPSIGASSHRVELKKAWAQITKAASIEGLRIHDLRHSYASQLISGGASLALVGALLGHSNPLTTSRYAHLHHDPLRAATEKVGAVIAAAGKPVKAPIKLKRGHAS